MNIKLIEINSLVTDGLQSRDGISKDLVNEYAEAIQQGQHLPPVEVVKDSVTGELYLVDGYHRLAAVRKCRRSVIDAQIEEGSRTDAVRKSIRANATHGLRRSNADKRTALLMAWENRQELFGGDPSHEVLAEACQVSKKTVQRFRHLLAGVDSDHTSIRVGKDGKTYHMPDSAARSEKTDRFDMPIPENLVAGFELKRIRELVSRLREVGAAIRAEQESENLAFARISQSTLIAIANAANDLKAEMPYCVCRLCGGRGCRACGNTGMQTKAEYDRCPREVKAESDQVSCAPARA